MTRMHLNILVQTMLGKFRAMFAISGQSDLQIDQNGQHVNLKRQFYLLEEKIHIKDFI